MHTQTEENTLSDSAAVNKGDEIQSAGLTFGELVKPVLNALSDMVRVVTREGKVAFTNDAFDRKLAAGQDTRGHFCYELFDGQKGSCDPCVSGQVMASGKARQLTRKLGDRVYAITVSPLKHPESGDIVGTLEVFKDITLDSNIRNTLVTQNSKLRSDLILARRVQQALVKGVMPKVEGYELCAYFFPCEAVGGDMYDCDIVDGKVIMYVSDASGHGVMPAMLGVFFSRAVRSACALGLKEPAEILSYVQKEFMDLDLADDAMYITGFILVLDPATGDYTYSNAGLSVPPVVCHDKEVTELLLESPPVSRWFANPTFKEGTGHLDPGDRILIYSDGIENVQSDPEVLEHLYDLLRAEDFTGEGFVRAVRRDLLVRHQDDLTMLICERSKWRYQERNQ